eukprot:6186577-Pleurochrysis_carterae.AAC.3
MQQRGPMVSCSKHHLDDVPTLLVCEMLAVEAEAAKGVGYSGDGGELSGGAAVSACGEAARGKALSMCCAPSRA